MTDIGGRRLIDEWPPLLTKSINAGLQWLDTTIVVHDACHSWAPDPCADFGIVSFYPTKLVCGAEGGAVICKKEGDAEELAAWLYCGLRPGAAGNGEQPRVPGRKANMTDVTAALNLEALELAPAHIEDVANAWRRMRVEADRLGVPYRDQLCRPYLFQVDHPDVDRLRAGLKERGIPSAINFRPATLTTVPCHRGANARQIMEAVADVLRP